MSNNHILIVGVSQPLRHSDWGETPTAAAGGGRWQPPLNDLVLSAVYASKMHSPSESEAVQRCVAD
jgi:hypothetical protein